MKLKKFVIMVFISLVPFMISAKGKKHTHDGFYLRLTTGLGYGVTNETVSDSTLSIYGMNGMTTLGIGYAIKENVILNLDIFGAVLDDPNISIDGEEIGQSSAKLQNTGLGAGLTYYVMPQNIYITTAVGIAANSIKAGDQEGQTDTGFGANFGLGKEWWVSENWGLGVAGQFFYTNVPDQVIDEYDDDELTVRMHTFSGGILFSATYN